MASHHFWRKFQHFYSDAINKNFQGYKGHLSSVGMQKKNFNAGTDATNKPSGGLLGCQTLDRG